VLAPFYAGKPPRRHGKIASRRKARRHVRAGYNSPWRRRSGSFTKDFALDLPLATILLPGLDGTGRLFRPFLDVLPPTLRPKVISYPEDAVRPPAELLRLIEASLPPDGPFAVIAESFSGPLALKIATAHPRQLIAVVLVGAFVRNPVRFLPAWLRFLIGPYLFRYPPPRFLVRRFLVGPQASPALVREVVDTLRLVAPAVMAARVADTLSLAAADDFVRCPAPLLYIEGTQDRLIDRATAAQLRSLRPDLECASIEAPHLILQRCPAEATAVIEPFLLRQYAGWR
jgi:pimeloyl-[acyl-carrier protein] methyl ester esterase